MALSLRSWSWCLPIHGKARLWSFTGSLLPKLWHFSPSWKRLWQRRKQLSPLLSPQHLGAPFKNVSLLTFFPEKAMAMAWLMTQYSIFNSGGKFNCYLDQLLGEG